MENSSVERGANERLAGVAVPTVSAKTATGVAAHARSARRESAITPYLYLLPAFIIYVAFFIYPFIHLIILSMQEWDGIGPKQFVWFDNYRALVFDDKVFRTAVGHNVFWLVAAVIVPVLLGLLLAILLYRSPLMAKPLFRLLYFFPQILSSIVVAIIWNWIYDPNFGALNRLLEGMGLGFLKQGWLGEPNLALASLFFAWSWIHYGFTMVIFIAALQGIDETYFDAAKVDGASWLQQFRHVLIPFIQGPLTTILLITGISSFQVFDIVYVLTAGGPANHTMFMAIWMYQNAFQFSKVGYGSAIAVLLGLVILVMSIAFLRLRGTFGEQPV